MSLGFALPKQPMEFGAACSAKMAATLFGLIKPANRRVAAQPTDGIAALQVMPMAR